MLLLSITIIWFMEIFVSTDNISGIWVYEDLPELKQNLTIIYNDLAAYNYSILLETAVNYYDELLELTYAIEQRELEGERMLRKVCDEGGPTHAIDPPYQEITCVYGWTEEEKKGYSDLMRKTRSVWESLKPLVKEEENLESESSGNF